MKKLFLTLTACILTLGLWADTSITEKFTRVSQTGSSGINGSTWTGDVCGWQTKFARRKNSDQINSAQATWITVGYTTDETPVYVPGYIKTTNLEGGIKKVSFKYAQFGAEAATTLKWRVSAIGETTSSDVIERDGDDGGNGGTGAGLSYAHSFNFKGNAQLEIYNASVMENGNNPDAGKARLLVGDITITPYLLYRNKDVTVGLKQRGYANNGSQDFINNTGNEGSIEFSSSNTAVATVDPETGVITPISVGDAVITATWSEGASTTYKLHVVDGIIAENFSKVVQTGQTASATWHGDLWDWSVANVRRGEADTLGLSPRIQGTAMRSNTGSTLISDSIEGGVKHLAFDWRQWATATSPLTFNVYYSSDKENWGDAVATQSEENVAASAPHVFDKNIDDGAKGNAYLKIEYTSGAGSSIMGAMKITPWLLYTTKEATLDTGDALTFTNNDLINNTSGDPVEYSIAPTGEGATINNSTGEVTVDNATEGDFTITATWGAVTTTYTLHVLKPKYYITGIGGWDLKQVAVYEDSYTFEDLPADSYALKVTDGDSWDTSKGFSHLTASEVVAGLYSGGDNNNICFTLAEAGNVTVTYTNEVFKLEGAFTPQVVKVKGAWDEWATTHLMDISEDRKSASITMELPAADEVQFGIDINGDDYRANQYGFKREYNTETGITGNTGNMKLTSDKAGDYTFTWIFGTNTLTITFPEILVYRVAGDEELMGSDWNTGDDDNAMTLNEGIYKLTKTPITLNAATYKYKVVGDDTWRIAYPSDNAELTINARGVYSVEFTFNPSTKAVSAEATYLGPATAIDETDVKAKAEKKVVNGQLIIEKNGVRYNVIGQAL